MSDGPQIFVKDGEGNYVPIPGQVIPTKTDINTPEGWDYVTLHNVKDMVEGWSTLRAQDARRYGQLGQRAFDNYDSFAKKMEQEYLDERADLRTLQKQLNSIFTTAMQLSIERAGLKTDVTAAQMAWDSQRVMEDVIESGAASANQTQNEAQSTTSAALASQAYTANAVESAISASLAAMTTDLAQSFRNSIEAMQTSLAQQLNAQSKLILDAVKSE